jgi:hypothetical protein
MTVVRSSQPPTRLDLDLMAHIAEQAGRDAFREPAGDATSGNADVLGAVPGSQAMFYTATRLYRACLSGATHPAAG